MKVNKIKERTYYYKDELNDDFGNIDVKRSDIPESYKYIRTFPFSLFANIFYWGILFPFLTIYLVLIRRVKVIGKENIKKYKKLVKKYHKGGFIYSNHTSNEDAFDRQVMITKRRTNITANSNILSSKFLTLICKGGGFIPVGPSLSSSKKLMEAISYYSLKKKQDLVIFPEAHIWPFYTGIREFKSSSFHYPAKLFAPVLPVVTIYPYDEKRERKNKKPKKAYVVIEPIMPKEEYSIKENKIYLHEYTLNSMKEVCSTYKQSEYIKYIKISDSN